MLDKNDIEKLKNKLNDLNLIDDYNFLMICNNFAVSILKESDKRHWCNVEISFKEKDKKKVKSGKYNLDYFRKHRLFKTNNQKLL